MKSCQHGTRVGFWCDNCRRIVRPSVTDRAWNHYIQAPAGHDCPVCNRIREENRATPHRARRHD